MRRASKAFLDTVAAIVLAVILAIGTALTCAAILGLIYAWAKFAQLLLRD